MKKVESEYVRCFRVLLGQREDHIGLGIIGSAVLDIETEIWISSAEVLFGSYIFDCIIMRHNSNSIEN